jgi:hypothetical protein
MSRFMVQEVEVSQELLKIRDDCDYDRAWEKMGKLEARLNPLHSKLSFTRTLINLVQIKSS